MPEENHLNNQNEMVSSMHLNPHLGRVLSSLSGKYSKNLVK